MLKTEAETLGAYLAFTPFDLVWLAFESNPHCPIGMFGIPIRGIIGTIGGFPTGVLGGTPITGKAGGTGGVI